MTIKRLIMMGYLLLGICVPAGMAEPAYDVETVLRSRSPGGELIEDHAGILADMHDYTDDYLKMIRNQYGIEAMIAALPHTGQTRSIEDAAVEMMENWKIGGKYNGRGLLLILIEETKQVKMEVARELEDVFTDAFTGYIEDKQLKNYYLAGDVGTGLIAVMEEIEKRARLKFNGDYDADRVQRIDDEFITQGAGARRNLERYQPEKVSDAGANYPAGATPDEAWQTMIRSYKDKARDPDLGVYTAITRLAYRDYTNLPDSFYNEEYEKYANKPYEIIEQGDYAVVFFGNKKGWNNAPFLLSRTSAGWQFDIVRQRKYVRMGRNPDWGIELGDYPHVGLLGRCPRWMGQDIPLEGGDKYEISEDVYLAGEILDLKALGEKSDAFGPVMELARLYVKTAFNLKAIPLLKRCKQLDPVSPLPYKYLAIAYVDAFYQYGNAIAEMEEYVRREPDDVFGRNYLGYLYLHEGEYDKAIGQLEKAVELREDNVYALCKLSRAHGQKYLKANAVDIFKNDYKRKALEYYEAASHAETANGLRVSWLKSWLAENRLVDQH
ncbi:MAG: TPM domain-containing protein [Candidatus Omnitrophota bacterium]